MNVFIYGNLRKNIVQWFLKNDPTYDELLIHMVLGKIDQVKDYVKGSLYTFDLKSPFLHVGPYDHWVEGEIYDVPDFVMDELDEKHGVNLGIMQRTQMITKNMVKVSTWVCAPQMIDFVSRQEWVRVMSGNWENHILSQNQKNDFCPIANDPFSNMN